MVQYTLNKLKNRFLSCKLELVQAASRNNAVCNDALCLMQNNKEKLISKMGNTDGKVQIQSAQPRQS